MSSPKSQKHVVIAGGGVAAIELALALRDLAADRVRLTMIAPGPDFELRALRTAEPFSRDHVRRHALADFAADVGAELVADEIVEVDAAGHAVVLASGSRVSYDALVVAAGASHRTAYVKAMTFTGDRSTLPFNGLLADIDEGYAHAVSFIVPPGATWPLPLYELALMTAAEAWAMGIDDMRLQIVSPEQSPLALFGEAATAAVTELLDKAKITFRGSCLIEETSDRQLVTIPDGEPLNSQRVVALPTIEGLSIHGLPSDEHGFIPVDDHGRVRGLFDVYAAGDGADFPIKQGGLACQQADAVAEMLANGVGVSLEPQPFAPVLRGRLMVEHGAQYLERALGAGKPDRGSELRLWSVARKIDGRYLSPWLASKEDGARGAAPETLATLDAGGIEIEVPLHIDRSDRRAALRLDPYSPLAAR